MYTCRIVTSWNFTELCSKFYLKYLSTSYSQGSCNFMKLSFIFASVPLEVSRHQPHNFLIGSAIFSLVSGIFPWVVFHSFVDVWNKPRTDLSNTSGKTEYDGRVKVG